MVRRSMLILFAVGMAAAGVLGVGSPLRAAAQPAVPKYDHVFVIVEENHGYSDVIGNAAAPNLNKLAQTFGLSTDYFGVSHPSEPNYVGLLGGDTHGVSSDDAYYTKANTVNAPSLISQMDSAGIAWKAYLQDLPHPNYQGICYPANCNGSPDKDPLYVSKHDGIQNYTTSRSAADWNNQVPIQQLQSDLASGSVPRFGYVIPTECQDQHGDPPYCIDGGNPFDPQDQQLVAAGDKYLGDLVQSITNASFWGTGNNAIDITYDEGDDNAGCCNAGSSDPNGTGGGQVANIVVTNHGPRGVTDSTPSNHYSLLSTIQQAFGLGCLANTCDTANVKPLASLFAQGTSTALATTSITPSFAVAQTPAPTEPITHTSLTTTQGGWHTQIGALLGSGDNSLGAVAMASPSDAWAAGNFLPDDPNSNQDATLSLAEHWDGTSWTVTPTPNSGPNFNTLNGITGDAANAWAVGVCLNSSNNDSALVETWNGSSWALTTVPEPGTARNILFSVSAAAPNDVWAVGDQQGSDGKFETLVEHFDGTTWTVVPSPNPGPGGNHLYGVTAAAGDVWAVGEAVSAGGPDQALVEHWSHGSWTVVPAAATPASLGSTMLFSVARAGDSVFAAGQSEGAENGAAPLVEQLTNSGASLQVLPKVPSNWSELWGIAGDANHVEAVGTLVNPKTGSNEVVVMRRSGSSWSLVNAPDPGDGFGGSNILGGVAAVGGVTIATGSYDTGGNRLPLIETH